MKIIFIRHGETDHNVERRIQGHRDTPLNDRGIQQAQDIADVLNQREKVDAIFTSDLSRAAKTAEIISSGETLIVTYPSIRERHMGELEGMLHSEALEKRKSEGKPSLLHYGENEEQLSNRLLEAYDEIVALSKEKGYKTIVIVSHGSALYHLFEALVRTKRVDFANKKIRGAFFHRPKLGNCSVTIVNDGKLNVIGEQWTESIVRERDLV